MLGLHPTGGPGDEMEVRALNSSSSLASMYKCSGVDIRDYLPHKELLVGESLSAEGWGLCYHFQAFTDETQSAMMQENQFITTNVPAI